MRNVAPARYDRIAMVHLHMRLKGTPALEVTLGVNRDPLLQGGPGYDANADSELTYASCGQSKRWHKREGTN